MTKTLKTMPRPHTIWLAVVGVTIPLLAILAVQFFSLTELKKAAAGRQRLEQQRYLEMLVEKISHAYESRAAQLLNLPREDFANDKKAMAHFGRNSWPGARLIFIVRYSDKAQSPTLFVNPTTQKLESFPDLGEQRHVNNITAQWRLRSLEGSRVQPSRVRVYEINPETRIVLVPQTDELLKVTGVAGAFLDHDYFRNIALPQLIVDQPEGNQYVSPGNVIVTARDPFKQLAFSTKSVKEKEDEVSVPMRIVFSDWRLGIQSDGFTPEQWARTNFLLNLTLTSLMMCVLLLAIIFALHTSARRMRLSQMKSDFVSNVSHELRTPLSSITVFAEFFRLGWVQDEQRIRECGGYIEAESRRLTQLIDNILDFSRIESGQKTYAFEKADLLEVVCESVHTFEVPLKQKGVSVVLERPSKDLPLVYLDREAIAQAFMNLLDNAAKYSGNGKQIVVRVWGQENSVNVSVRDEGIGISSADQKMIFEKFYRVSTGLVHDTKGSGLGLAIVEHIVRSHGGQVTVESEPGSGSTFVIQLPTSNANQDQT